MPDNFRPESISFRPLRESRASQALSEAECREILGHGTFAVLAVQGDFGFPYAVPVNYVLANGKIYIHGAPAGHKTDAVRRNPKVSLAVVAEARVRPELYATRFRSVIVFGTARMLEDQEEKEAAVNALCEKVAPGRLEERADEIRRFSYVGVIEVTPLHVTGKMSLDLLEERNASRG